MEKFRYYVKNVYGNEMAYPYDARAMLTLHHVRPEARTVSAEAFKALAYFGVETEQVLPPKAA